MLGVLVILVLLFDWTHPRSQPTSRPENTPSPTVEGTYIVVEPRAYGIYIPDLEVTAGTVTDVYGMHAGRPGQADRKGQ